ncbi:hypothetical protein Sango_0017100 [Sesamum angolense]|uniref:Integrase zinc-binding domain-containing protein n=1 Tax=Sesamum angolense TaxID=2727404 RepID=A0AAE1XDG4_9LAMI|nr:hypothetical protein Sango_0017100 [Sesamum angolense]
MENYTSMASHNLSLCLIPDEGNYVLREKSRGNLWNDLGGKALEANVVRQGFFWPTMLQDTQEMVKCCCACQEHANINHQPAALMQLHESPCPFDQWGMDLVGPFPQAAGQRKFLIVAVVYFTKWYLTTEPNSQEKYSRNGAKGNLLLLSPTGRKLIAPAEIRELNWRVKHYDLVSNVQGLRMNIDFIDDAREIATTRVAMYKARMAKAYNARVRQRNFQVGDLVLRKADASGPVGKVDPKWEEPYKVVEIVNEGAYKLQ